jgi:restriction system protein
MTIPDFQSLMLPLLRYLADDKERRFCELIDQLTHEFSLTEAERRELLPSGQQPVFDNRVGWARTYLKKAGLLESPRRGWVRITQRGLGVLKQPPERITIEFLKQFEEFRAFIAHSNTTTATNDAVPPDNTASPEELLGRVYEIKKDRLGFDVVYVQAKRWEQTVSRPEVQKFAGALQRHRARKGVFLTTSTFTKEVQEYVEKIDSKIVLIDGERLAELMFEHNVGVSTVTGYPVKRIDNDFLYGVPPVGNANFAWVQHIRAHNSDQR